MFRKDSNDMGYQETGLKYVLAPCDEISCIEVDGNEIYKYDTPLSLGAPARREQSSIDVPLGYFEGYKFYFLEGILGGGYWEILTPQIGVVYYWYGTDYSAYEQRELVSAFVDGIQYGTICVKEQKQSTLPFEIHCSYPNPFNPSTTITYTIAKTGNAILEVFNVLGQKVDTLFDGYRETGTYSIRWDASRQANGIYIVVMKAGGITKTEKMMLVK